MDKDEFDKMIGVDEDIQVRTVNVVTKAENLYRTVSGMADMAAHKGYSMGGAAQNISHYVGLDWEIIDNLCAKISFGTVDSMDVLLDRLKDSTDPDDAMAYRELSSHVESYVMRNIAYHNFWIGFFCHDVAVEDQVILPVLPTIDVEWDSEALMQEGLSRALVALEDYNEGDQDVVISELGLSLRQIFDMAEKMEQAGKFIDDQPGEKHWSTLQMVLMTGVIIGRSLGGTK